MALFRQVPISTPAVMYHLSQAGSCNRGHAVCEISGYHNSLSEDSSPVECDAISLSQ